MAIALWGGYEQAVFEREALWFLTHPLRRDFFPFRVEIEVFSSQDMGFFQNIFDFYVSAWEGHKYRGRIDDVGMLTGEAALMECVRIGNEAAAYFNALRITPEPHHILGEN